MFAQSIKVYRYSFYTFHARYEESGSRAIAPEENTPPPPNLKTNPKPNPNPTREDQFTSGPTDWLPPTLNLTLLFTQTLTLTGEQFSSGGNCPDTKEFSCLKKVIHQIDRK